MKPGASIPITSVPNLRDLGGWPVAGGGRVRTGLLYRSTELDALGGSDMEEFAKLGIATVFDLRTEAERSAQPDRLPPGAEAVVCDVLADSASAAPAQLQRVLTDPGAAEEMLGGGKAIPMFEHGYREIVALPSARDSYRRFFADLAEQRHRPALFHCTTGKDRTGWAAATILALLGVAREDVVAEYLLTNDQLLPALQPLLDQFQQAGGDPALLGPVLGVRREYLDAAFDEMDARYGSFQGYVSDALGIDADAEERLRSVFVEPESA